MKKITLSIDGNINDHGVKEINSALNDLSGVVAADVVAADARAYAYAGDQLDGYTVSTKVREAGYDTHVLKEEYITDVSDYQKDMFPTAAPVTSILNG